MRNKVDIFSSNSYGFKEPNNANNMNSNRKLLAVTDPIPRSEIINVESYLKMFLLFTSDMKAMFSGKKFD